MKNVAILSHWGFDILHGGNLRAYFLIKKLIDNDYKVNIICSHHSLFKSCIKRFGKDNIQLYTIDMKMNRFQSTLKKIIDYAKFYFKVKKIIKKIKFDSVIGFNLIHALPISFQRKSLSYIYYVDYWGDFFYYDINGERFINKKGKFVILKKIFAKFIKFLEYTTIFFSKKIIMVTEEMKSRVPFKKNIKVIPDGAELDKFQNVSYSDISQFKEKYNIKEKFIIGYQGGVAPHEGLQFAVEAAKVLTKKHKDVIFLVAGEGEFLKVIKELVNQYNLNDFFVFTGWLEYKLMPVVLKSCDISIVPMPAKPSSTIISLKLLEGLSAGIPMVVSDISGVKEIVSEKEVWLCDVENSNDFSETLEKVMKSDKQEIKNKVENGLKTISNLDWNSIAERDFKYFFNEK